MIDPGDDIARRPAREATDAVTVSLADPDAGVHGVFRLALDPDGRASAFGLLFLAGDPVAVHAESDLGVEGHDWSSLAAGPLRMTVAAPLEGWTLRWESGEVSADLVLTAASAPAEVPDIGGLAGYEQLCDVQGTVRVGEDRVGVAARGQRSRLWGTPDWRRLELTRSVAVWFGEGDGLAVAAARAAGARGHDEEAVWGALVARGEPVPVADARLSTTYDGEGRQRRAGLELWVSDDAPYPERAAGEAVCGSTLDLGPLRLDVAFFTWRADGREGVGRYDLLRRA